MGGSVGKVVKVASLGAIDPNKGVNDAAKASRAAANRTAKGQGAAADFLKERDKTAYGLREASLKGLGGLYGLPGFEDTLHLADQAKGSPIYQAMSELIDQNLMDEQNQAGTDASARGFLRSGPLAQALAQARGRAGVNKASALSNVYQNMLGGVQNLAQYGGANDANIANLMAGQAATLGQGMLGQSQTVQAGYQQNLQNAIDIGKSAAAAFSDIRLKENIRYVGEMLGHEWFAWDWNKEAEKLGLSGPGEGVMAHLVEKYAPHAIGENSGFMTVNYGVL